MCKNLHKYLHSVTYPPLKVDTNKTPDLKIKSYNNHILIIISSLGKNSDVTG